MRDTRDRSRYWNGGALVIETPRWSWPSIRFIRNGRMVGLTLSIGRLYVDAAVYKPPWTP